MATDYPVTMAVRALREHAVSFTPHVFTYENKGGTAHSAQVLGVDEHTVIKTLVFEDEHKQPFLILMHGDREVSQKALARIMGKKRVGPCAPDVADRHSGYLVGGTSPFGTKRHMPVFVERSVCDLPIIYINGGARGFLVAITPTDLVRVLQPTLVEAAT